MFKKATAAALLMFLSTQAIAQTSPGWSYGQVPTAAQWNAAFATKQDVLGYRPINQIGDTMLGRLTFAPSLAVAGAGVRFGVGAPPNSPVDGDFWITVAGAFMRINGTSLQILTVPTLCDGVMSYAIGVGLQCGQMPIDSVANLGVGVVTTLKADVNASAGVISAQTLSTTLPSTPGIPWNNGGMISISQ